MTNFISAYGDAADTLSTTAEKLTAGIESPHALRMHAAINSIAPVIRGVARKFDSPSPDKTDEANYLEGMEAVEKASQHTTKLINTLGTIDTEWNTDLVHRENAQCGFERGSPDGERILNKFAAKDAAEQLQDLAAWLKDPSKGHMIGLVAKADPYVTNLTPELAARFRADFVKLHAPALAREREAKGRMLEAGITAASLTQRVKASVSDPRRYSDIRDRKAKHSEADAAFLKALAG